MKNGVPEFKKDAEILQRIYNKLTIYGQLKEPLTAEEAVLIFCISKWMKKEGEK